MMCIHHYRIIQSSFAALNNHCAPPIHPLPSLTPDNHTNLFVSVSFSSRISYSWNHIVCTLFQSAFSLRNMHLRFIHVFHGHRFTCGERLLCPSTKSSRHLTFPRKCFMNKQIWSLEPQMIIAPSFHIYKMGEEKKEEYNNKFFIVCYKS
jgi:hypothetical protein